jgi:hypothetical protein
MDVGLLSTYELFRLIQAVQAGQFGKETARELIKTPGLIKVSAAPSRA